MSVTPKISIKSGYYERRESNYPHWDALFHSTRDAVADWDGRTNRVPDTYYGGVPGASRRTIVRRFLSSLDYLGLLL